MKVGIVFDGNLDSNDGVQQYIKTLAEWLIEQGHEVKFLVSSSPNETRWKDHIVELSGNFRVRFNRNHLRIPLPASTAKVKRALEEDFDILHVQVPYNPFLAGKVIKHSKCPVVGTFHIVNETNLGKLGSKILSWVQKGTSKKFSHIMAVSPAAQVYASKYFSLSSNIVPNMVNSSKFKSNAKGSGIVFLGRLEVRKGVWQLLNAYSQISEVDRKNLKLTIGGSGPELSKLKRFSKQNNLDVEFKGYIPEESKAEFLASSEVAVFPSIGGESFGIVLLEAMATDSPVVLAADNPGYSYVMETMPSQIFNPQDSQKLASKLISASGDKFRQKALKLQRARIKQLDINTIGPKILKVYEQAQDKA